MIFIEDGPDIPEEVLHALRNDNLVLFCGAGISKQSGLPSFKELVTKVCSKLNVHIENEPLLKDFEEKKKYDHILDMVEENQDFSVGRQILRKTVIEILSDHKTSSYDIHKALLSLSALQNNKGHRLVTTNMDQLFCEAGLNLKLSDIGPRLVPARTGQWKNLTFLHGLIDKENDPGGNDLVLTRADFGLAYLYDNWASRFIIQLFQEFDILFIGYSLDDLVMQYLVSAISSENRRKNDENKKGGQSQTVNANKTQKSIYAFVGYKEYSQESDKREKWKSMGINPILYKVQKNENHSLLYKTIKEWANLKKTGLSERKQWLRKKLKYEKKLPKEFKETDKWEVKSVFSFLKIDERLSEYLPQINPHISLLKIVSELPADEVIQQECNLEAKPQSEPKLLDNLVRPRILTKATESVKLNNGIPIWESLSVLENSIVLWLCNHLDKKELIHWVIEHDCILNTSFKLHIQWAIQRLENQQNQHQQKHSENTLKLDKSSYLFWKTIIDFNYYPRDKYSDPFRLTCRDLQQYCLLKAQEFINLLEPYIEFEKPFYYKGFSESNKFYKSEIAINSRNYPSKLTNEEMLLKHAEDFSDLLKKAMQKAEQFEIIQNGEDYFYIHRPSIDDHRQNKHYHSWTYLIDLTRDSFDLAMKKDQKLAKFLLRKWQQYPYSVFYRLILYAATKYPRLDEEIVVYLFKTSCTLWSVTCQNEVLKYLKNKKHSKQAGEKLIKLIIQGPPRSFFKESINDKQFTEYKERGICQRLNCLKFSGVQFLGNIEKYYNNIQQNIENYNKQIQKKYKLAASDQPDDSDDFPFYCKGAGIVGNEKKYHNLKPQQIYEDIKSINLNTSKYDKENKRENFWYLVKDNPQKAYKVLLLFQSKEANAQPYFSSPFFGIFISDIVLIEDMEFKGKSFFGILKKMENFNDDFFKQNIWSYVNGFNLFSAAIYLKDKSDFHQWWNRFWHLSLKDIDNLSGKKDTPMMVLNSSLGKIFQCIFDVLWRQYPDKIPKNDKIPEDIKQYFEVIIKNAEKFPFILYHFGVNLWFLWYLDREWVLDNIKPLLDKKDIKKHKSFFKAIWAGYLHDPQLSPDFLSDFKKEIFDLIINRRDILSSDDHDNGRYLENISGIFFTATGGSWLQDAFFNTNEIEKLKKKMNVDVLEPISHQIWKLLADSKEKSGNLWSEKIKPWIEKFWPQQKNLKNEEIARNFSLTVLYAGHKLPEALSILEQYIKGHAQFNNDIMTCLINKSCFDFETDQPGGRVTEPHQLDSIFEYPKELLKLLIWNIPKQRADMTIKEELKKILDKVKDKYPEMENNEDYKKLRDKLE